METSAQLVNLSDKAPAKLVEAVVAAIPEGEGKRFQSECSSLIAEAKAGELIPKLLTKSDVMLEFASEEDIEGGFGILFSLLFKTVQSELPRLTNMIVDALLRAPEGGDPKAPLRLKLVTNLCNMLPVGSTLRFDVLLRIIGFASETGLLAMLSGFFEGVDELVRSWNLSVQDQGRLYLMLADIQEEMRDANASQRFLLKYLATVDESAASSDSKVKAAAARAAIGCIKAPITSFMQQHNVLGMAAVMSLEHDPEYSKVHELLKIFSEGMLVDYLAFAKSYESLLGLHSINHEECIANMRVLSLCSLAMKSEEVCYADIAEALQIDIEDVEHWVIKATQAGLMLSKMDQFEQVVQVSQCTSRVFGGEQWVALQQKLHQWENNVSQLLDTIQCSRNLGFEQQTA